jgi:hypothetical protein
MVLSFAINHCDFSIEFSMIHHLYVSIASMLALVALLQPAARHLADRW